MIDTQTQLQQVFADNFVVAYRAQVAHVNILGRNFYSDHRLLGKIYQHLQDNIDVLAEHLRTLGEFMPTSLDAVLRTAQIADSDCEGTADELLLQVQLNLQDLVRSFSDLAQAASDDDIEEIENYAQEEILALNRWIWMISSTISDQ